MHNPPSEELATALSAGLSAPTDAGMIADTTAARFEAIYATYLPLLRKIAVRKFGVPTADAENLVHDVFATYLTNPDNVRSLHAYLIGAICNAARQYHRRGATERSLFCGSSACLATPDNELADGVIRNVVIGTTLARLGPSCRDTLQRFYLAGETAAAIAQSRNTSANYILRLLHYCRSRARALCALGGEGC